MELGPFGLISIFYVILGVRVVFQLISNWQQTWDLQFTAADRSLVDQAAFFVLLPVGVALHELGHAAAIWAFGGSVVGWGYYGFAGYVSYYPWHFTLDQRVIIAAAGTIINIALAAAAVAFVFLRRPPARAAINELLIQFVFISLLNALVLYPLLDVISGMNGDWTQMYFGGVPSLSVIILVIHVGILATLFWAWRSAGMRARIAALTGAPPGLRRIPVGGRSRARVPGGETTASESVEAVLREAADRVVSGWPVPVEAALQDRPDGTALMLSWTGGDASRAVVVVVRRGGFEVRGVAQWPGAEPDIRALYRSPVPPATDPLTMTLRLAMEAVEQWRPAPQAL